MVKLTVNGRLHELDIDPDMPLLWALRDAVGLTGTKYGCGQALCGVCTVHIDDQAVRSCVTPVAAAAGRAVRTIEGLDSAPGRTVKNVWQQLDVVQCGYCQSGQIMSAAALLAANPDPDDQDINQAMSGNICRCATYVRIRAAIKEAARRLRKGDQA